LIEEINTKDLFPSASGGEIKITLDASQGLLFKLGLWPLASSNIFWI
jgi:hypothetical protein